MRSEPYPVESLRPRAGSGWKALSLSTVEMIGSPLVTGCELQQLLPCAGRATLAGQFAESLRQFSIVCAVKRWGAVP
jgi:hypothetical protein